MGLHCTMVEFEWRESGTTLQRAVPASDQAPCVSEAGCNGS